MTNHKQRRVAKYRKLGMINKAIFASGTPNNRSKRARGKIRAALWKPRRKRGERFEEAKRSWLNYPPC